MSKAEELYDRLMNSFGFKDAQGELSFRLKDISIRVYQNNVVGNILEEWLDKWMTENNIEHVYNHKQESPDFWLSPDDRQKDWLEIKSFTGSPNFDVAAYRSFINLIIDEPYKLQADYLLIKYKMEAGVLTIENCWLKKVWQICSSSQRWPVKVQCKNGQIFNIRPAYWYGKNLNCPVFDSLEHFLSALEETVFLYPDTHRLGETWKRKLVESYKRHYGETLDIPRWNDIKPRYINKNKE